MAEQRQGSTKRLKARAAVNEQKAKELITRESALQLHESNSFTETLRQVLESIYVALFIVLLIILDTVILMDNIITGGAPSEFETVFTTTIIVILCVEVSLRIWVSGAEKFFLPVEEKWVNIIDFVAAFGSMLNVVLHLFGTISQAGRLVIIFRLVRVARILTVLYSTRLMVMAATRRLVSENRRRFQDDEFDLDLVYVTDHLIAMSLPAHKATDQLYRNKIEDVAKYLDKRHPKSYVVVNVTSERDYPTSKFHDQTLRFGMDDHNCTTFQMIQDFCAAVDKFFEDGKKVEVDGQLIDRVAAIHCKGGKGRTGLMISCYLLHSGVFETAEDALSYFASRRTDFSVGDKYQGVQTPSQERYVKYYEMFMKGRVAPKPKKVLHIKHIRLYGVNFPVDIPALRRLWVVLKNEGDPLTFNEPKFDLGSNCIEFSSQKLQSLPIAGDVKVQLKSELKLPKQYDKVFLYFWFNTSFLNTSFNGTGKLVMYRDQLDNGQHKTNWRVLAENVRVELEFFPAADLDTLAVYSSNSQSLPTAKQAKNKPSLASADALKLSAIETHAL